MNLGTAGWEGESGDREKMENKERNAEERVEREREKMR